MERALAKEHERLKRERGPLPEGELDRWHKLDGPGVDWQTNVRFVIRDGRPVIAQLMVSPYRATRWSEPMDIPAHGLTTTDLRHIHIRWDDELHQLVAGLWSDVDVEVGRKVPRRYEHKSEDDYAERALEYLEALRRAPRSPLAWLEEKYRSRGHVVTRAWLRDMVHGARVQGFLTPGTQGRAGAEPTEKLEAWLEANRPKNRRRKR